MIEVRMTFDTLQQAAEAFAGFAQHRAPAPIKEVAQPPKPEKALSATTAPKTSPAPTPTATIAETKSDPKPELGAVTPSAKETATPKESTEAAGSTTATASPSELTYDVVFKAITARAKDDREGVVALLAKYNAKRGSELTKEQWAPFYAELTA